MELKLKLILLKFMGRIILLSSDRLVGMVSSRAAAAVRQARRARARLDAWIVREGAGSRERLRRGPASSSASASSASVPGPVPVPVPPPVRDTEAAVDPEAPEAPEARTPALQVLSAPRGGLQGRTDSSSSPDGSSRRSRSSPRASPRSLSRSSPRSAPRLVGASQESDSRLGRHSKSRFFCAVRT